MCSNELKGQCYYRMKEKDNHLHDNLTNDHNLDNNIIHYSVLQHILLHFYRLMISIPSVVMYRSSDYSYMMLQLL